MKIITLKCNHCHQSFQRLLSEHNKNLRKGRTKFYCCRDCTNKSLRQYNNVKRNGFKKGNQSPTQFKKGHKNLYCLKGEESYFSVLTNQNVLDIRQKWRDGTTIKELCKWSGMSDTAIRYIVQYKTWKHLP